MIGFLAVILHLLWVGIAFIVFTSWRRLREDGDTTTVAMARLRPGMEASVRGRLAFHGVERTSLLGAEPAVWFDWKIQRLDDASLISAGRWITEAAGRSQEPFAIVDDAGNRVLVWPMGAEVRDAGKTTWDGDYPDTMDEALRGSLSAIDAESLHSTERWLPPGMDCVVSGRVEAPGPGYGPDMRGLIRTGGSHALRIAAGGPLNALAERRRNTRRAALIALAALVLAVIASIHA
ncbi:MAG: hypothetical protein KF889_21085 [Alphaproteobacteria bacterium]|nr:hypothetical protein [Alphaproteobacteria bacterium]MCW5743136.1 hypothetical protein [Alphaproteobacteria bacterium]